MKKLGISVALSALLFVGVGTAQAIPYIYTFSGTVTETRGSDPGLASIAVGDRFIGSFFYSSYGPYGGLWDEHTGNYRPILSSFSLLFDDLIIYGGSSVEFSSPFIRIDNQPDGDRFVLYDQYSPKSSVPGVFVDEVYIFLNDSTGTAFTDPSLPFPLDVGAFDSGGFDFYTFYDASSGGHQNDEHVYGRIDAIQVFPPAPPNPRTLHPPHRHLRPCDVGRVDVAA